MKKFIFYVLVVGLFSCTNLKSKKEPIVSLIMYNYGNKNTYLESYEKEEMKFYYWVIDIDGRTE